MQHTSSFLALVKQAKQVIKEINIAEVGQLLEQNPAAILVDVREDREWINGHLPKAIHLGKGVIERDIENTIPDKATVLVLYCGGGYRSALAAENLQKMGYKNVISMDGGFHGWVNAGLPYTHQNE